MKHTHFECIGYNEVLPNGNFNDVVSYTTTAPDEKTALELTKKVFPSRKLYRVQRGWECLVDHEAVETDERITKHAIMKILMENSK